MSKRKEMSSKPNKPSTAQKLRQMRCNISIHACYIAAAKLSPSFISKTVYFINQFDK